MGEQGTPFPAIGRRGEGLGCSARLPGIAAGAGQGPPRRGRVTPGDTARQLYGITPVGSCPGLISYRNCSGSGTPYDWTKILVVIPCVVAAAWSSGARSSSW